VGRQILQQIRSGVANISNQEWGGKYSTSFSAAPAAASRPGPRPLVVPRVTLLPPLVSRVAPAPPAPAPAPASAPPALARPTATPATPPPEATSIWSRPASVNGDSQIAAVVGSPVQLVHCVLTSTAQPSLLKKAQGLQLTAILGLDSLHQLKAIGPSAFKGFPTLWF